jgi:hypothetical protein
MNYQRLEIEIALVEEKLKDKRIDKATKLVLKDILKYKKGKRTEFHLNQPKNDGLDFIFGNSLNDLDQIKLDEQVEGEVDEILTSK